MYYHKRDEVVERLGGFRDGVTRWGILPRRDFLGRILSISAAVPSSQPEPFGAANCGANVNCLSIDIALVRGVPKRPFDDAACCRCNLLRLNEGHH